MTVLCIGDSNTYGFDTRSPAGDRYPPEIRWTGRLARATGWRLLEAGQNGREIPRRDAELEALRHLPERCGPLDLIVLMLGSNDLLMHPVFTAEDVAARMEVCLTILKETCPAAQILLVAPVPMVRGAWVWEDRVVNESARLAGLYRTLAEKLGISFADAGTWKVELLFDGVHFSEAGHRAFAEGLQAALKHDERRSR